MAKECVLVLGPYKESLVIVRSLARAGFRVVIGSENNCPSYAEHSRYRSQLWPHPLLTSSPFIPSLRDYLASNRAIQRVVAVGDLLGRLLATQWDSLPHGPLFVMASGEALLKCQDKAETYRIAGDLGIPVPPYIAVGDHNELQEAVCTLGFPCVIKANQTPKPFLADRKAVLCRSHADVVTPYPWPSGEIVLVQRCVPGLRHNCHFVARNGRMLVYFEQKVLRTDHVDGTGLGVDSISVAPNSELRDYTGRLVKALAYSGPGCAQFLCDEATGAAMFLEINPRFDATIALPYQCGCDLPLLALQEATGSEIVPTGYEEGKRIHWFTHDLATTLRLMLDRQTDLETKRAELRKFCSSAFHADCHMTFELADPAPTMRAALALLSSVFRRLTRLITVNHGSGTRMAANSRSSSR